MTAPVSSVSSTIMASQTAPAPITETVAQQTPAATVAQTVLQQKQEDKPVESRKRHRKDDVSVAEKEVGRESHTVRKIDAEQGQEVKKSAEPVSADAVVPVSLDADATFVRSIKKELKEKIYPWHKEMTSCFPGFLHTLHRYVLDRDVSNFRKEIDAATTKEELKKVLEKNQHKLTRKSQFLSGNDTLATLARGVDMISGFVSRLPA